MTDRLEELARENERLREVLRPFDAVAGELFALNYNRTDVVFTLIASEVLKLRAGDFFNVRAALT